MFYTYFSDYHSPFDQLDIFPFYMFYIQYLGQPLVFSGIHIFNSLIGGGGQHMMFTDIPKFKKAQQGLGKPWLVDDFNSLWHLSQKFSFLAFRSPTYSKTPGHSKFSIVYNYFGS